MTPSATAALCDRFPREVAVVATRFGIAREFVPGCDFLNSMLMELTVAWTFSEICI